MATRERRTLDVDVLSERADAPIQVVRLEGASFGSDSTSGVRAPHRHDYHELLWIREGCGLQRVDGEPMEVVPGTLSVVGRGQVHVFEGASNVNGAVIRFNDDMLYHGGEDSPPSWLLTTRAGASVRVPAGETPALEATIDTLAAELARPSDRCTTDLERHLLLVIMHWLTRWYDGSHTEPTGDASGGELALLRRFTATLERDYARHHDAVHYADALAVPAPALSKALTATTGKATKALITDRVMLEAARLLRFTDLSVSEVAHRVGFEDPLYFSRAFKRQHGEPPQAFRERSQAGG